jgi:hypothetical protein
VDGDGRVQQVELKQKMVQQDRALHRMEVSTRGPTRALYVTTRDMAAVPDILYDIYMSTHVNFACSLRAYKCTNKLH